MIIDDHFQIFWLAESCFTATMPATSIKFSKDAIATYGIPDKLYVDNGCSYSNEQLSMICVSLGILLLHTKVRDGASKGKVERYEASREHPRKPLSREWLDDCFYNRITRKVRKDSTIAIDSICYDVPMQFISAKVDVRYLPDDMDSAYILYENKKFPIRRTDRNDNCHTKRSNLPAIDYSRVGGAQLMYNSYYGFILQPIRQTAAERERPLCIS